MTASSWRASWPLATGDLPERPVVLTFDDGFADFHSEAMERLDRYGFTATLFMTTGWVRDAKGGSDRRPPGCMLRWGQIEEAVSAGIEVAAHSHLHPELDQLPPELMRDDLATGKAVLEDTLGIPANGLAYPFGYFDARVRDVAEELGHRYSCAVANTMMDSESDLLALPRLTVRRSTDNASVQAACSRRQPLPDLHQGPGLDRGLVARSSVEGCPGAPSASPVA